MNRLFKQLATVALVLGVTQITACSLANTAPPHVNPTPTPAPTPKFTNDVYAAALRTASVKLRGKLPDPTDLQGVLSNGQPAYEALIDKYLDPVQNPLLGSQIRSYYNALFLMGGNVTVMVGNTNVTYNDNEPPNLATYIFLNDKPMTEMLTANYCINDTFQIASGTVDGAAADAQGCASDSTPIDQRAGVISQKTFLAKFGQANTVNMRRMSVIHQIFNCNIYPDAADVPLLRTNDTTQDAADANNANATCAVDGCPDNGMAGLTQPAETCSGSNFFPCNNNGTASDPSDDFADPSLGLVSHDPGITAAAKPRVSKKYQSKLAGAAGQACADCHGSINARRPIMIPYDENGKYDMTRTISSVESPANNGTKDYCGTVTPNDATDDIDPEAGDCANGGLPSGTYFGTSISTLKDYGAAVMAQPRFYDCMTTRTYDFVLGKSQGELGLQAAGGTPPTAVDPAILSKYKLVYEGSQWNTRELVRNLFKGDEFLTSQM